MLELVALAAITATAALVLTTLVRVFARTTVQRVVLIAAYIAWFSIVTAIGATHLLEPPVGIGVAGLGMAVTLPLLLMAGLALGTATGRASIAAAPLLPLAAIQILRVIGVFFVILYALGRVPAPFGPVAGWGDVVAGLLAILLTVSLLRQGEQAPTSRALLVVENVFGTADLLVALTLGATSSPGPIQLFHQPATTAGMLTLPWILIPCFLVPSFLFLHLVTFARLRQGSAVRSTLASTPANQTA